MSQEQAYDFIEKMKSDEEFRDAVIRIEDVKEKIEYLDREGIRFTADELLYAVSTTPAW